jgi:hypothetical protein
MDLLMECKHTGGSEQFNKIVDSFPINQLTIALFYNQCEVAFTSLTLVNMM